MVLTLQKLLQSPRSQALAYIALKSFPRMLQS